MDSSYEASGATDQLAAFAANTQASDLGDDLVVLLKRHLLDQIGIQLACIELPWIQIAAEYAYRFGKDGSTTVVGTNRTLDAEFAAFVNATAGHGFELDDCGSGPSAHPGCNTVPAVLAVAEEQGSNGLETLVALAIGFESVMRIGQAVSPSLIMHRGFHETCVEGVFSSALGAGKLMGFTPEQYVTALGIAGSHASGTTQFSQFGGDVKRLHAGIAATGGIRSARLTSMGFTAPREILEGRRGILQAMCEESFPEKITDGLGTVWEFQLRATLKIYACAGAISPRLDAVLAVLAQTGRSVAEIDEIVLGLDRKAMGHVGSVGPCPTNVTSAQFSSEFATALSLIKGDSGFDTFLGAVHDNFSDPDVLDLAKRIRVEYDQKSQDVLVNERRLFGTATVRFKDGTIAKAEAYYKGDPTDPLTQAEVEEKFLGLATRAIPESQAREVMSAIERLETLSSVRELTRLLVP